MKPNASGAYRANLDNRICIARPLEPGKPIKPDTVFICKFADRTTTEAFSSDLTIYSHFQNVKTT